MEGAVGEHLRTMKIHLLMIAMCSCGLSSPAFGNMISSYFDDKKYDFEFSCDDMSKTPAWPEEDASPPLEPREAVRIATAQLSTLMQDSERWRLNHISLRPACTERHWFYVVTFSPPPPRSDGGVTPLFGLVVLMNGQSIEPKVSPWRSAFQDSQRHPIGGTAAIRVSSCPRRLQLIR